MTKNTAQAKQTVRIFDTDGNLIGTTYPKRAAGLVKKGRAQFVNDCDIRLIVSDVTTFTEETMMDNNTINLSKPAQTEVVNKLYFNAREWVFNKECKNNVGNRSFMQSPDGTIAEAYMMGNWGWDWTEIISKTLLLPKNTLHTFTFWLNGGENDRNNEVCRFEIVFNNDYENRYTYNLNRNFIKPVKKCGGWELYEIPFRTGDNEYTQLKFVAQCAYMTVMGAKDAAEYADLPDTHDPYEAMRPQRHNIVFADGWPTNTWYSTANLAAKHGSQNAPQQGNRNNIQNGIDGSIAGIQQGLQSLLNFDFNAFAEQLKEQLSGAPGMSEDDINEIIEDSLSEARDNVEEAINELSETLEELTDMFG